MDPTAHAYTLNYPHTLKRRSTNTQRSQQLCFLSTWKQNSSLPRLEQLRPINRRKTICSEQKLSPAITTWNVTGCCRPRLPDWGRPAPIWLDSCGHWNNAKHNLINRLWKIWELKTDVQLPSPPFIFIFMGRGTCDQSILWRGLLYYLLNDGVSLEFSGKLWSSNGLKLSSGGRWGCAELACVSYDDLCPSPD